MSKKSKLQAGAPAPPDRKKTGIIAGAVVVALFAGIGIALVTAFGGSDLSKQPDTLPAVPALTGAEPEYTSPVSDLLTNKSFDDYTDQELADIRAEVERVFDEGSFRASSANVPGIDIVRHRGRTRAARQYAYGTTPNGVTAIQTTRLFYCETATAGQIDVYKYVTSDLFPTPTTSKDQIAEGAQPLERALSGLDWTRTSDQGFEDINGHHTHQVVIPYLALGATQPQPAHIWFDTTSARLIRWSVSSSAGKGYDLDWRAGDRIMAEPEVPQTCVNAAYPPQ